MGTSSLDDTDSLQNGAPRACGAFLLFAALLAFYVGTYKPVHAALALAPSIDYYPKVVLAQPPLFVLGVIMFTCGPRTSRLLGTRLKPSILCWLLVTVGVVVGLAYEHHLVAYLSELGYPGDPSILQMWMRFLHPA